MMRSGWTCAFLLALFISGEGSPAGFASDQDKGTLPEYTVKAGFLYNFAKYVDWPADAHEKDDSPLSIGIVGADPFGEELDKALKNKTVKDRRFVIRRFADTSEIARCHILFVPRTEKDRVAGILKRAESWPVLTVGEDADFAKSGGSVSVLIENERPRLEVNPETVEKARLTISSKLLKLATLVKTAK
jgi:hypothetical protein